MKPYVQPLTHKITAEDQKKIIDYCLAENQIAYPEIPGMKPFWKANGLRRPLIKGFDFQDLTEEQRSRFFYLMRLNSEIEWEWIDTPITSLVQKYLFELSELLTSITRVSLILQIPGLEVPAHRDLIVGEVYNQMTEEGHSTFRGGVRGVYKGDAWFYQKFGNIVSSQHTKQNYLGLRIPLSETGSPGLPFIQIGPTKYHYNTEGHLFLLDEVTYEHGADPVDFYRGVVIVDGALNTKALPKFLQTS